MTRMVKLSADRAKGKICPLKILWKIGLRMKMKIQNYLQRVDSMLTLVCT